MISLQVFKNTCHFENELYPCTFPRNDIEYITFILDFNIVKDIEINSPPECKLLSGYGSEAMWV
jgi:hypothetical protein